MTRDDLERLACFGTRITIFAALENGVELCDLCAEMTAVVGDEHNLPVVIAEVDGREIRLPVDTAASAALLVVIAGGRL